MNQLWAIAAAVLVSGCGLIFVGVYLLFGTGWALIAGAAPFLVFGGVLVRGLTRA